MWCVLLVLTLAVIAPADVRHCAPVNVPGAAYQQQVCLGDLTTTGTVASGHTDPADWAGLTSAALPTPSGVPGIQVDGYFPDSSTTNTNHGWLHDSQFVLRLPDRWNGGLVVTGSPGVREQYANDRAIGDWVLARGYAFAATDKGNTGVRFYRDGAAIEEWNRRLTQLTIAAKAVVAQRYGRPPHRTIATGLSNGGYLVRWQLENRPWLYDGGVDWEGTLWTVPGPNLLTFLPPALRAYPAYLAGDERAHADLVAAEFPAGSEFLWDYHYRYYWDLTQRIYREELDPGFDGPLEAGVPFCVPGSPACDADYDYAARRSIAGPAVAPIALSGRLKKPLITLHGTYDVLLPISRDSDVYAAMTRGHQHRYYRVEQGTHVDGLVDVYPDRLRPLAPCHRSAFEALERWLDGTPPPPSATLPRPADTGTCPLG
ncbi:3-hydroxybutyrate oligomer hydrolase family protein [Lentzea sp. NBRC 105346]|uniref:tannase/feruloyl esterase family alpha/beta hydrolase n=1 Tax=Lentzea sp. NBRC 105346 TaxID=3032205 RepID=UPI002553E6FB|nr:3-hydroxybutyrate oligomer hydrolase family protein [Lentzea sp. NBRC 105346]